MNKDNIDIMAFLNSMQGMQGMQGMQKMSKIKKNKKSSRCTIKEEDNVYIKECDENETDAKDEEVIKNVENIDETKA